MRGTCRAGARTHAAVAAAGFALLSTVPVPASAQSQLMVASRPPGATVYVDGAERGRTPLVLSDLKPGSHEVKLVLDGHRALARRTRLKPGPNTLDVELEAEAAAAPAAGEAEPGAAPEPSPEGAEEEAVAGPWDRAARRKALRPGKEPGSPTAESEAAVDRAVGWLASVQEADGRWEGERRFAPGDIGQDTDPGVTGLALLALMGAGHSQTAGAHAGAVRRGLAWLVSRQAARGEIGGDYDTGRGYNHAIAGLALAEAFGMSRAPATGRAAQKAVDYSVDVHQSPRSAWRYRPGEAADLSVTAWFVQQLAAARDAGLRVKPTSVVGASSFLGTCWQEGRGFAYQPGRSAAPTMTAAGLLCLLELGRERTDERVLAAAGHVMRHLPRWEAGDASFYHWYYGTTSLCRIGGEDWGKWNRTLRETLLPRQKAGDGALMGSWDPAGMWCGSGGRVYATAMAALCLEAPYRGPGPGR